MYLMFVENYNNIQLLNLDDVNIVIYLNTQAQKKAALDV